MEDIIAKRDEQPAFEIHRPGMPPILVWASGRCSIEGAVIINRIPVILALESAAILEEERQLSAHSADQGMTREEWMHAVEAAKKVALQDIVRWIAYYSTWMSPHAQGGAIAVEQFQTMERSLRGPIASFVRAHLPNGGTWGPAPWAMSEERKIEHVLGLSDPKCLLDAERESTRLETEPR